LSITAPVLFGHMHVLPVVTELLTKHPALEVRFLLLDRVVSLAEEGIDVAVRIGQLPDSSLKALTIEVADAPAPQPSPRALTCATAARERAVTCGPAEGRGRGEGR